MIRGALAALAGFVAGVLLFQVAAIVQFVAVHGVPLGASPAPPSPTYLAVLLVLSAVAAGVAGWTARRIAAGAPWPVVVVAVSLAAVALWGFSGPGSRWPLWWAPALAIDALAGVLTTGLSRRTRHG